MTAAGISSCATGLFLACSGQGGVAGLVVAPMTSASATEAIIDASSGDAPNLAIRALPEEPRAPTGMIGCQREVHCVDPEADPLAWPLPSPFERCKPLLDKGEQKFSVAETARAREAEESDAETCCYLSFPGCSRNSNYGNRYRQPVIGRPLFDQAGEVHMADTQRRRDWMLESPMKQGQQRDLARAARWARTARLEHASVASFGHFALSLMAVGAPSELVEQAHQAAIEEIEHARLAFGLASSFGDEDIGPGPLHASRAITTSLRELVRESLRSGCVNEAISAALATEGEQRAQSEAEKSVLGVIARDEASHAALAYRTVAWALSIDREGTRQEIREALTELERATESADQDVVLDEQTRLAVTRDVLTHAVRPCLLLMLA